RQHRTNRIQSVEHEQMHEGRGEAPRDDERRPAPGCRDRERRAEQRDDDAGEGDRQLERALHAELLRVRPGARQGIDVASQLDVAHLVRRLGLREEGGRRFAKGPGPERVEAECRLLTRARIWAALGLSQSERMEYTPPPSGRYTNGLNREARLLGAFSPRRSARRADVTGASSVSPKSSTTAASDASNSGRTTR